ncbi:MAG: hypothetical protein KGZ58_09500 [Ignavibacteriales bacterium]|nr:hypothetical protein [Ignavibacteriales bacterium]
METKALTLLLFLLIFVASSSAQFLQITTPKENTVSTLHRQAVSAIAVPNANVQLLVNSQIVKQERVRIDGIVDFLNIEVPDGDVVFEVQQLNDDGSVIATQQRSIHIFGKPSLLSISTERERLYADKSSTTAGTIHVFDKWNYPLQEGIISVAADSGTILSEDIDETRQGVQIRLTDGVAEFEYQAGTNSGVAIISAQMEQAEGTKEIYLNTPNEPLTLIGLASGTANASNRTGSVAQLESENAFPDKTNADGRLAVYARGTVMEDYLLTLSYDSDRRNRSRLFRDVDPDFLYSIYGDNSMLSYDGQSKRNLFAKLEQNQTYAMFGDYNTDLTKQEFTLYSRSLNGIKVGHQDKDWKVTGFGSLTDRKVARKELRGQGLSGFYDLGSTFITPGTEKIHIETRDKFHSEVLLRVEDKYRFSDYDIDYQQGTLFFKQPVAGIDNNGNPVYIVVSYEATSTTDQSYITGGRVERTLNDNLTLGVSGITEEQSPSNYTLFGGDLKYQIGNTFSLAGEMGSSSNMNGSGLAYKVESSVSPFAALSLKGYYRNVESGFFNITQSGGARELGTKKYGASGNYQLFNETKLSSEAYQQKQDALVGSSTLTAVSGTLEQKLAEKFSGVFRIEDMKYASPTDTLPNTNDAHSTLGTAKVNYFATEKLTLSAFHERNLGTSKDNTRPNSTALAGEYKVTNDVSLLGQQRFYESGGSLSEVGINTTPAEGTNVYGKYEIGNAIGQRRNMASIGLKNRLKLTNELTSNFSIERTKNLGQHIGETTTPDHSAISTALEYLPEEKPVKAVTKIEFGDDNISRKWNFNFGGDYRFKQDFSLILKYRVMNEDAKTSSDYRIQHHWILGLAYRPVNSNWFNTIAKAEIKRDKNYYVHPFINYGAFIVSDHSYIEPIQRLELGVKFAYKIADESSYQFSATTHTLFYLFRAEYDITKKFDIGAEYRLLNQTEARDLLDGYSAEIGYAVVKDTRIAVGYNFKGYKEKDLVDYTVWSSGPFVKFNVKFDEESLGIGK